MLLEYDLRAAGAPTKTPQEICMWMSFGLFWQNPAMLESEDGTKYLRIIQKLSAAVSRAISACRPVGLLQRAEKVAVTVRLDIAEHQVHISVSDTGRAFCGAQEVAWCFQKLSGNANRDHPTVRLRTTALDESSCREYSIAPEANSAPVVAELPSSPKVCPQGPFSGSEVSFAVRSEAKSWLGLLNAVQDLLETVLMTAPPVLIELRIQGFDTHVQSLGLEPLPKKVKYSLEPLASSLTPSERLKEGLRAFFLEEPGIEHAPERLVQQAGSDSIPQATVHVGCDQPAAVSKTGTASWTACAGLVLSQDAQNNAPLGESETGHTGLQLLIFENYGYLHRPQDNILKAIEKVNWTEYNLPLEGMLKQADGSVVLKFAAAADQISKEVQLLVIHLVSAAEITFKKPKKRSCPPGLSIQLEAKLVKSAVEDVLLSLKQSRPLTMMSPFEQRMACLSHISRSIAGIVSTSENPIFQGEALQVADSSPEDLLIKIQACLEDIALNVMAAAAEKAPVGDLRCSDAVAHSVE